MIRRPPRSTLFPTRRSSDLEPVQGHRRRDGVEPGRQRRLTSEPVQPLERANEGLLREVPRELVVPGEPVGEAVDPVHVGVVERAFRGAVPGADPGYQFAFVHGAPELGDGRLCDTRCGGRVACESHKGVGSGEWYLTVQAVSAPRTAGYHSPLPTPHEVTPGAVSSRCRRAGRGAARPACRSGSIPRIPGLPGP